MNRRDFAKLCYTLIDCYEWLDYYEAKGKRDGDGWQRMDMKRRDVLAEMREVIDAELEQIRTPH